MSEDARPEDQHGPLTNGDTNHVDDPPRNESFNNLHRGMDELVRVIAGLRRIDYYMEAVEFEAVVDALRRERPDLESTDRATRPWRTVTQHVVLERVWRSSGLAVHFLDDAYEAGEWQDWDQAREMLKRVRLDFAVQHGFDVEETEPEASLE